MGRQVTVEVQLYIEGNLFYVLDAIFADFLRNILLQRLIKLCPNR